jgi:alpha-beta hydrolase superfamily lysophospholipase
MQTSSFSFETKDGSQIFVHKWIPNQEAKGIVQVAHGMSEHSARYGNFAAALVEKGYIVYANDHRGHGRTAGDQENLGYFADEHGWERTVEDLYQLTQRIRDENPYLPVFLFGHSMGSFLCIRYIQKYGKELSGVILSGTGSDPGFLSTIGIWIAKREMKKKGKKARSELLNKLSFGSYNKAFKPNRTEFDWLTRDKQEVDKYIEDPYCGEVATAGFFYDMISGIKQLDNPDRMSQIPKELPIFIFSGDKDPVGNYSKGVIKTFQNFKKAGIKNISCKLYKDGRHEMLNEINREEVFRDVIQWLNKHL